MSEKVSESSSHNITELLQKWSEGDEAALEKLAPLVYQELHRIARRYMARERSGHTLQPTAVVNEVFLRLVDWKRIQWQSRAHFYGVAAQMMRRILVSHARSMDAAKRGDGARPLALDDAIPVYEDRAESLIAVDEALTRLAGIAPRKAKVVELRFFGGLGVEETAEVLNVSHMTVVRDWDFAKAWLLRELRG
jgi:RNA polymerase sigma factor (TIGR02999 family)